MEPSKNDGRALSHSDFLVPNNVDAIPMWDNASKPQSQVRKYQHYYQLSITVADAANLHRLPHAGVNPGSENQYWISYQVFGILIQVHLYREQLSYLYFFTWFTITAILLNFKFHLSLPC